jgi:RNA polymerase-binding transcription factor DksA
MAEAALSKTRSESSGDLSSMPMHMADVGTDNFEQEFTLSLLQSEEEALVQIEGALERIEEGTYGSCVECDAKIAKARLNAIPYTPVCIKCASKIERD